MNSKIVCFYFFFSKNILLTYFHLKKTSKNLSVNRPTQTAKVYRIFGERIVMLRPENAE